MHEYVHTYAIGLDQCDVFQENMHSLADAFIARTYVHENASEL